MAEPKEKSGKADAILKRIGVLESGQAKTLKLLVKILAHLEAGPDPEPDPEPAHEISEGEEEEDDIV